jgi:hypothetical protein
MHCDSLIPEERTASACSGVTRVFMCIVYRGCSDRVRRLILNPVICHPLIFLE